MQPEPFRALLADAGLRQRGLAALLGVRTTTVSRWCLGGSPPPRYAVVFMLAFRSLDPDAQASLAQAADNLMGADDG
jgi:transcriptional regulator with XRE-family HTH domain